MAHGDHSKAQILRSLDTGLRVLKSLSGELAERGVTDLARELGTSKASMYRVLCTLERQRYVVQNPVTGRYRLGPYIMQLGQSVVARMDLLSEARPYLDELRDRTKETVHLDILDGGEVLCVAKADGLQHVQVMSRVGKRGPAHCVSTGKVMLAHADPGAVERLIDGGLVCYTERTHATARSLLKELEAIRREGYAINWGEWKAEAHGVGAPIFDSSQQVVAAIGICGPANRLVGDHLACSVAAVVDATGQLSEQFGGPRDGSGAPLTAATLTASTASNIADDTETEKSRAWRDPSGG